jgi:hypothetical protein
MGFTAVADVVMGAVADTAVADVVASAVADSAIAGMVAGVGTTELTTAIEAAGLGSEAVPAVESIISSTGVAPDVATRSLSLANQVAASSGMAAGGTDQLAQMIAEQEAASGVAMSYEQATQIAQSGLATIPQSQWGWQDYAKAAQMGLNLVGGLKGLTQPAGKTQTPTQAQLQSDPWSKYRAGYGDQLNALMNNPALTMTQPGYQFMKQQGLNTLQAAQAQRGQVQSGAGAAATQMFGANYAMNAYDKMIGQYSGLAGAGVSPAVGGAAYTNAQQSAQNAQMAGLGTIAGTIGSIANIYGGGTNTSNYGTVSVPQTPTNIISGNTGSSVDWYGF